MRSNHKPITYPYRATPIISHYDISMQMVGALRNYIENYTKEPVGVKNICRVKAKNACLFERIPEIVLNDLFDNAVADKRIEIVFQPTKTAFCFTHRFCELLLRHNRPLPNKWNTAALYVMAMAAMGTNHSKLTHLASHFEYRCQILHRSTNARMWLFMDRDEDFMSVFMEAHDDNAPVFTEKRLLAIEARNRSGKTTDIPMPSESFRTARI